MMPWVISRRSLLAISGAGAMACLGEFLSFIRGYAHARSSESDKDLIALCSELGCPKSISKACLDALPPHERGLPALSTAVLALNRASEEGHGPSRTLAQSIRDNSRADFQEGRVCSINGWMIALTEARLYALAGLLPETDHRRVCKNRISPNGPTLTG